MSINLLMCDFKGSRNRSADGNKRDAGHLHGSDDAQSCDGIQSWSQYCTEQLVGSYSFTVLEGIYVDL